MFRAIEFLRIAPGAFAAGSKIFGHVISPSCYRPVLWTTHAGVICNSPSSARTAVDVNEDAKEVAERKRDWPRQLPEESEAIMPPRSTSVAATSNASLFKDLFRGQLHLELLEFPELSTRKEVDQINELHERIKHFMLRLDSEEIDQTGILPSTVISAMREQGLFGLQIDSGFAGQGLTHFQAARAWEAIGVDLSVFAMLDTHALVSRLITTAGTENQRRFYLPKLATGEHIGALCVAEVCSGSDLNAIRTEAVPVEDGQVYVINGRKCWITNGALASLFIVLARVAGVKNSDPSASNITAFLVDRTAPGVTSGVPLDILGVRGSSITDVTLQSVRVPASNILGTMGGGIQLLQNVSELELLNVAAASAGLLRYLISYATEHCLQRHQFGRPIGDYGLVRSMLANLALDVYAMESGVFYLAGLVDAQPTRDLGLEISGLKIFCSEALWNGVNSCMQLTGRAGLEQVTPFGRYFRDCRSMLIYGGTNDVMRLRLAGAGLQHIAGEVEQQHAKLHVFARHPWLTMKTLLQVKGRKRGWFVKKVGAGPKAEEGGASRALKDHLHPNFAKTSTDLAILVQRFRSLSEAMLITYGQSAVDQQMALARMTDCAVDLLMSAICLGRASRSISIGLPLHDYEVRLANTFVKLACERVETNLTALQELDRERHRISSELLSHRTYPVTHPLSRVW